MYICINTKIHTCVHTFFSTACWGPASGWGHGVPHPQHQGAQHQSRLPEQDCHAPPPQHGALQVNSMTLFPRPPVCLSVISIPATLLDLLNLIISNRIPSVDSSCLNYAWSTRALFKPKIQSFAQKAAINLVKRTNVLINSVPYLGPKFKEQLRS